MEAGTEVLWPYQWGCSASEHQATKRKAAATANAEDGKRKAAAANTTRAAAPNADGAALRLSGQKRTSVSRLCSALSGQPVFLKELHTMGVVKSIQDATIRFLVVRQPWAMLLVAGLKTVENRVATSSCVPKEDEWVIIISAKDTTLETVTPSDCNERGTEYTKEVVKELNEYYSGAWPSQAAVGFIQFKDVTECPDVPPGTHWHRPGMNAWNVQRHHWLEDAVPTGFQGTQSLARLIPDTPGERQQVTTAFRDRLLEKLAIE
jgi:hypothetical protein